MTTGKTPRDFIPPPAAIAHIDNLSTWLRDVLQSHPDNPDAVLGYIESRRKYLFDLPADRRTRLDDTELIAITAAEIGLLTVMLGTIDAKRAELEAGQRPPSE